MHWYTKSINVDVDTGEIVDDIDKVKNYLVIKTKRTY